MYFLTYQLQQEYSALQGLRPEHGPTAIAFRFANIKVLLLEMAQKSMDNSPLHHIWLSLDEEGMNELDAMVDFYGDGQTQHYDHSFSRLRYLIAKELINNRLVQVT